jgi:uncharacterized lipoprotein YmbA
MNRLLPALVLILILGGCARSPTPALHALSPLAEAPAAATAAHQGRQLRIVIAATTIPQSVDRPQLIVEARHGGLAVLDAERWAEPLKRAIPRTLAHYLSADLNDAIVWSAGTAAPARPDARIMLEVARWHSALGRYAAIDVLWTVRAANGEQSGRTVTAVEVAGAGYDDLIAAHRVGLQRVGRDLAAAVRAVVPPAE